MSEIETSTTNDLGGPRFSQHLLIAEGEQKFRNMKKICRSVKIHYSVVADSSEEGKRLNSWDQGSYQLIKTERNTTANNLTGKFGGCHGVADNNYLEEKKGSGLHSPL